MEPSKILSHHQTPTPFHVTPHILPIPNWAIFAATEGNKCSLSFRRRGTICVDLLWVLKCSLTNLSTLAAHSFNASTSNFWRSLILNHVMLKADVYTSSGILTAGDDAKESSACMPCRRASACIRGMETSWGGSHRCWPHWCGVGSSYEAWLLFCHLRKSTGFSSTNKRHWVMWIANTSLLCGILTLEQRFKACFLIQNVRKTL
jgi:hypothetical protein